MLLNMHIFKIYVSFDLNGDINDHFSFISQNFSFFLFFLLFTMSNWYASWHLWHL